MTSIKEIMDKMYRVENKLTYDDLRVTINVIKDVASSYEKDKSNDAVRYKIEQLIANATKRQIEEFWFGYINERQVGNERESGATIYKNKSGFTMFDAHIAKTMAARLDSGKRLSSKQISVLRRMLPKYWKQYIQVNDKNLLYNYLMSHPEWF